MAPNCCSATATRWPAPIAWAFRCCAWAFRSTTCWAAQRCWSGYRASAQALFDLANLLTEHHRGIAPYRSIYAQKPASDHSQWSH